MLRIRPFSAADITLGLRLSRQAGWNQLAADWQRILDLQPDGGLVAEWRGTPVGTVMTTIFGPVAWISMVLVDESMRQHGIGTALVEQSVAALDRRGVVTVRLDATSLGQPLYERLGFVAQFRLLRFEGALPAAPANAEGATADEAAWERLAEFDRSTTGTDRRRLLHALDRDEPDSVRCVWQDGQLGGYLMSRPGFIARQLGPCCANEAAGELLVRDAWRRYAGQRVFMDVPAANASARHIADALGLNVQREFTRMCRGAWVRDQEEYLWASAGPEKG